MRKMHQTMRQERDVSTEVDVVLEGLEELLCAVRKFVDIRETGLAAFEGPRTSSAAWLTIAIEKAQRILTRAGR